MARTTGLSEQEIRAHLKTLPGWELRGTKLWREITFPDFVTAFAFMTEVALRAEKADHHPEWFNVYNRVRIELATHDAGSTVTEKDIRLAAEISRASERAGAA